MMSKLVLLLIRGYRYWLSPHIGGQCRFSPSCSHYTETAVQRYGAGRGSWMGIKRILRCGPWCEGGLDPVPEKAR